MKKKTMKVFSLITLLLLMSGCVKYNINMKITKDKKMNMELIMAVSKNLKEQADSNESTTTEEQDEEAIEKLKKEGWKVEDYEDEDFTGSRLTKDFNNIDEISTSSITEYDFNSLVQEGKESKYMFYKKTENGKTTYVAKIKANTGTTTGEGEEETENTETTTSDSETEIEGGESLEALTKEMTKTMDVKFSVEVPKVISHNATSVEGNKLTWDLTKTKEDEDIEFEFELGEEEKTLPASKKNFPIIPIAIGLGGIILFIILITFIAESQKKKEKIIQEANTDQTSTVPIDSPTIITNQEQENNSNTSNNDII